MNMISHHNNGEKMQRTQEYIEALEEERRKIQVFQRELPLCLQLVTQAIETCKQQLSGTTEYNFHGQSECSEQTSTDGPVLEEFIPLKRSSSSEVDEEEEEEEEYEHQSHKSKRKDRVDAKNNDKASSKKSDWLRSVQLWNQTPDPPAKEEESPRKVQIVEVKSNGNGGAFHPFKKEKEKEKSVVGTSAAAATQLPLTSCRSPGPAAASSTADTCGMSNGDGGKKEEKEKEGQTQRKARRCWSPELHKRFLMALQQLGGSHVATPKQIRELMKVDGLTNDEVKSHLQKYRLHNRRPNSSIHSNNNPQAPQFVVVGGIWMPPPEYAAMATTTTTTTTTTGSGEASGAPNSNGIYAPIPTLASPPTLQKPCNSEDRGSHSGCGGGGVLHSSRNSPVTSSSTDTTTASPATY